MPVSSPVKLRTSARYKELAISSVFDFRRLINTVIFRESYFLIGCSRIYDQGYLSLSHVNSVGMGFFQLPAFIKLSAAEAVLICPDHGSWIAAMLCKTVGKKGLILAYA